MRRLLLALLVLAAACGPSAEELAVVDYAPSPTGDWEISTPEDEGLDPLRVAELYCHGGGPWRREKASLNLVGDFIASLAER